MDCHILSSPASAVSDFAFINFTIVLEDRIFEVVKIDFASVEFDFCNRTQPQ